MTSDSSGLEFDSESEYDGDTSIISETPMQVTPMSSTPTSVLNDMASGSVSKNALMGPKKLYSTPKSSNTSKQQDNSVQLQLSQILTELKETNKRLDTYDEKFSSVEQRLETIEKKDWSLSSESASDSTRIKKRLVPTRVRHLVREVYKTQLDSNDDGFEPFNLKKKFSDADNQAVVAKLLLEVKGQDDTITNKQIKDAARRFFQSKVEELTLKDKGTYHVKVQNQRRRNRLVKKLEARKACLERTTALSEEGKARWKEILKLSFMSSEESGEEVQQDGSSKSIMYVKPIPWRSSTVNKLFRQLDHKIDKAKSTRAKLQTLPRLTASTVSNRVKPIGEFAANHWAFTAKH